MIIGHEKFRLQDLSKTKDFFAEVNWNPDDKTTNECQVIKFTHPDGSHSFVKQQHLYAMLFAIGNEIQQREMIPQKITKSRWYETVLSIKATKDIRRGESITFPIKITLPDQSDLIIGNTQKDILSGKKVIVPNFQGAIDKP